MKAKTTASGSAPPASGAPNGIEAAIAAAGAIQQIDWNTTSRNPTALRSSCDTSEPLLFRLSGLEARLLRKMVPAFSTYVAVLNRCVPQILPPFLAADS